MVENKTIQLQLLLAGLQIKMLSGSRVKEKTARLLLLATNCEAPLPAHPRGKIPSDGAFNGKKNK